MITHKLWLPLFIVAAIFFLSACDEPDASDTGKDVLPTSDLIEIRFTDTLSLEIVSRLAETSVTGLNATKLIGTIDDQQFGTLRSSLYTQFGVETDLWDFALSLSNDRELFFEVDSVVLSLNIISSYGRFRTPQVFSVHAITDDAAFPEDDTLSFSTTSLPVEPEDLCLTSEDCTTDFRNADTVEIVRFPLHTSIGEKILFADSTVFETSETFGQFFKGLKVEAPESVPFVFREPGAIYTVNMDGTNSFLDVYYRARPSVDSPYVSRTAQFPIRPTTPGFYEIDRDDNFNERLLGQIKNTPTRTDEYEFIQQGNLIDMFIQLPTLTNLAGISINQAELVLNVDTEFLGGEEVYTPPARLLFVIPEDDGSIPTISNIPLFSDVVVLNEDNQYNLNSLIFRNFLQEIVLNRRENLGFYLIPADPGGGLARAALGGVDHPSLKAALRLTYTTRLEN
ncbi:MAG: DUF4270 family protein [Bacteroidota bacterium]